MLYDVTIKSPDGKALLRRRVTGNPDKLMSTVDKLYKRAEKKHINLTGSSLCINSEGLQAEIEE